MSEVAGNVLFAGEEAVIFAAEDDQEDSAGSGQTQNNWKIMLVDDEAEVHNVTKLALTDFTFENKGLTFISAYSGQEARQLIETHPDTALILLDVVMETDDAGLVLARHIREILSNRLVRIVLRTGQPGQAPEGTVIINYDINDYKAKTELTTQKLFTTIVTALRAFDHLNTVESHRREIEQIAAASLRFVPKPFLNVLHKKSITEVQLGDQVQQEMTVMFSDIRSFTTLSEQMTPQENFNFVNSYLSQVSPIIREHHGFIDKYIGDAIMALFADSPDNALQAAVAMQHEVARYNMRRGDQGYQPINIGIGLHTGQVMLGIVGEAERIEGTVIADTVNLAARVEGLTKQYGAAIVVSERTLFSLVQPARYHFRFLDKVKVKGKKEPVSVFEILDGYPEAVVELKLQTRTDFEKGLLHYYGREFEAAKAHFQNVLTLDPDDRAAQLYLERTRQFIEYGVPVDWEGVAAMTEK